MSKRPSRRSPNVRATVPTPSVEATLVADMVVVRFRAPVPPGLDAVALLLDGEVAGIASVRIGEDGPGAVLPLPPDRLGQTIQVIAVPTGERLLPAPIDLAAHRRIEHVEWSVDRGRITGSFRLAGDALPTGTLAMPVQILADGPATTVFASPVFASPAFASPVFASPVFASPVFASPVFASPGDDATWRFQSALPRLAALAHPVALSLRIGGRPAGRTLSVPSRACCIAGHVDITDSPFIQGWAVDLIDPRKRVEVVVEIQGARTWQGPADQMRDDILQLGLSDGRSAFRVPFPKNLPRGVPLEIAVTVDGTHLVDSPYTVPAPPPFMGCFDVLEGPFAGGWVVNMHDPETPALVEALCDGEVIGTGTADLFRGDVEKSGMPTARCGFRFLLERPLASLFDRDIHLRIVGTNEPLLGSPRQVSQNGNLARFLTRADAIPAPTLQRLVRRMTHQTAGITLSIVMPVYNTRREWLLEALGSVLAQWSANWELICVDDGSSAPHVQKILEAATRHDPRIRVMRAPGNLGIARATNFGLRAARGAYVAFMDHDDTIEPDAVHKLALAAKRTGADLVYSDEAITTDDIGSIIEVRARPAFSYDYYLSHPYFVHMVAVRTELAQRLGGWDETLPISADVDFILRAIEQSKVIAHVPAVLYRWRTHGTSTGHAKQAEVTQTMLGIIGRHLQRRNLPATVREGLRYNEYRLDWPDDGGEVLIVIPTRNRMDLLKTAIDSIERTSKGENIRIVVIDHDSTDRRTVAYLKQIAARHTVMPYTGVFNYALMNNLAVRTHAGKARYVLFLNNDVEAIQDNWIARMRTLCARPDVGAVGPLLLYGDDRIQHAGVLVGFSGAADHAMKFQDAYLAKNARHPGYNCNLTSVRDYSAVTAACMMVPMRVFRAVKGFDEAFVVGFNDTDLCLRIGSAGHKVLYDGQTVLYHHESATRTQSNEVDHPEDDARLRKRWKRFFLDGDPFYSPLLAPKGTDHTLRQDAGCKGRLSERAITFSNLPAPKAESTQPREGLKGRHVRVQETAV